jgi:hypothetical protein
MKEAATRQSRQPISGLSKIPGHGQPTWHSKQRASEHLERLIKCDHESLYLASARGLMTRSYNRQDRSLSVSSGKLLCEG